VSTMMCPDLVVGEVGFGPNFGAMAESNWHLAEKLRLEDENRELIRERNRLKRCLENCYATDTKWSAERFELLNPEL
jgi:hypothetical protein